MNTRSTAAGAAMACLLMAGAGIPASAALAASEAPTSEAEMSQAGRNALNQASEKTSAAMFEVRAARVAIFNGLLEEGRALTSLAGENLEAARLALQVYRRVEGQGDSADVRRDWVPFNTTVVEFIDLDSDRQALRALDEASDYLARGKTVDAAEALLSEAEGGASITTAYLPVGSALELLDEAGSLLDDERYHEANMALMSLEDSARKSNVTVTRQPSDG